MPLSTRSVVTRSTIPINPMSIMLTMSNRFLNVLILKL